MEAAVAFTPPISDQDVIRRNLKHISHANFLIKSVYNKTRQGIIGKLLPGGSYSVYELCSLMQVEQSMMSQHLSVLRKANLVQTRRDGKFIYYSMNENTLMDMIQNIKNMTYDQVTND